MITIEEAWRLRHIIEKSVNGFLNDEEALTAIALFPPYEIGKFYKAGDRISYSTNLYKVNQDHTSALEWPPYSTPALYTKIAAPGIIPVWVQPTGAQDAYMEGDKVYYPDENGSIYQSKINNNVWSPETYPEAWELIE